MGCTWYKTKEENTKKHDQCKEITILFVMGPSSSGKATVGRKLAATIGYTYANTSTLLEDELKKGSSKAKSIIEHMQAGTDVPSEIIAGILKSFVKKTKRSKGFVISGFPNSIDQAQNFEFDIGKPKIIIYCTIPEEVYVKRNIEKHGDIDKKVLNLKYSREYKIYQGLYKLYEHKTLKLVNTSSIADNNEKLINDLEYYWGFSFDE